MKLQAAFLLLLITFLPTLAQDRYLVHGEDAIPIPRGRSAHEIALEKGWAQNSQVDCPNRVVTPWRGDGVNFGFFNGDVALMRILAPVTGVIESVCFETLLYGSDDSSAVMRIFESAFTPENPEPPGTWYLGYYACADPGFETYPWPDIPGCDSSIFVIGDSTSPLPFGPNGPEIWGNGGYVTTWHPNSVNCVAMLDLGYEPLVETGDYFNVNLRLPSSKDPVPDRNELVGGNDGTDPADFLKYYHRGRLTGTDIGWWTRVDFNVNIWTVIRASGNLPPIITSLAELHHTISTDQQTVCVSAFDCNPGAPADTGIASAELYYNVDGGLFDSVTMNQSMPGEWCADIPGMSGPAMIEYYVEVTDNLGLTTESFHMTYRIVNLNQNGYITTFPAYNWIDVSATGSELPGTSFFDYDGMTQDEDDGTAGPIDLGQPFNLFGQSLQYAWVGVNGAIALSATPDDTIHVNPSGFYSFWEIPEHDPSFPPNMIMTFWNDFRLAPAGQGSVWYQDLGTMFVVQWEGVGNWNDPEDMSTFEIILDRTDPINHAIYFQYEDVGTTGSDLFASTGLQVNPADQWLLICDSGYPVETVPANLKAIHMRNYGRVAVDPSGEEIPKVFALNQSYPNPFNPVTKIRYEIPHQARVVLRVYNILGDEVATLVDKEQRAGRYEAEFRGENLASGVYFYRLQADRFVQSKKMILTK